MSVKEWENPGSVPWGVSVLPLAAGSVWGVKASLLPVSLEIEEQSLQQQAWCLLADRAKHYLPLILVGSMQAKACGVQRSFWPPSSECVGRGERRWGYFRAGCRKSKVKAKSSPKACTFKSLGVRYIEYAGDWKRKEHAKLCNSIGCSCSNYWPGSNLPPTCSYRS